MKALALRLRFAGAAAAASLLASAAPAHALNPLEYPDNGANPFSRGGAWLATASDPIAVHYNPAMLATQASAVSIDIRLNYKHTCFDRRGPGNERVGPTEGIEYREACNGRQAFPLALPALAMVWRATDRLAFGVAVVPPSAYGTASEAWSALAPATDTATGRERLAPAPYRFMTLGNQSTILLPTASVGYEVTRQLRIGAGFISGMAMINVRTGGMTFVSQGQTMDDAGNDVASHLRTEDLFMPGAVASLEYSPAPFLDLAVWGRWVDGIDASSGTLLLETQYYSGTFDAVAPLCDTRDSECSTAVRNDYGDEAFERFAFAYPPPEIRVGARYHLPRGRAAAPPSHVRDPLHDDVFDVELDGSYTANSLADEVVVRFREEEGGIGVPVFPEGNLPPNADRPTGFMDSFGLRLGGQYNVLRDQLALMAGTWFETRSQDPALLDVGQPGPLRGGIGGGVLIRQDVFDVTLGYQFHTSERLDNHGNGQLRASAGVDLGDGFSMNDEPRDLPAVLRREYRTPHAINGGSVVQQAHVIAVGVVTKF